MSDELFNLGGSGASGYGVQVEDNSASVRNRSGKTVVVFKKRGCWANNDSGIAIPADTDVNWGTSRWPGYKNAISSVKIGSEACANR